MALGLALAVPAQKAKTTTGKPAAKTTAAKPKTTAPAKKTAPAKGKTTGKTTQGKPKGSNGGGNVSIKGLQNQRQKIQQQIKEQEQKLRNNERTVKQRLQALMMINTEIEGKRRVIDTIRKDISDLDASILLNEAQLEVLHEQLESCKQRYVKSMRYMHRNRSFQNQLMFIFSAKNMAQMYRRMRFMREYASYQHVQGDEVKLKQAEVEAKYLELRAEKEDKDRLLAKGEEEQRSLEGKQVEQQNVVNTLKKEQKSIQNIIAQQRKKDAALNAQIDKLVAEEVARQKAKAAAEAKKKAEAEAAKKKAAELARKRAQAEAAAKENARRVAEAKAREEKAKAEAQAAKSKKEKEAAERKAREAEQARREAERKAESEAKVMAKEVADAKKESDEALMVSSEDRRISGSFESNRGRLPMPITGAYRIVSHFGQYNVEGLSNVTLDNKGINIKGEPGCKARSIFDGEVSFVFSYGGSMVVMVRHGSYISVYCNLSNVSVRKGQKVTTRQVLGTVGAENILQFQLRKETSKLNPENWLGR